MSTVREEFPDGKRFEALLVEAESGASSDWEISFISDLRVRFDKYRENMYLSPKQLETIERIAHGE